MNERQIKILQALIEEFISLGTPIGSSHLLETKQFHFSGATLRNEMATLEKAGLLTHPYTSAGRTPTTQGYRFFVDRLLNRDKAIKHLQKILAKKQEDLHLKDIRQKLWHAVSLLSETTQLLAFATIPNNNQTIFLGIANVLRQPEFQSNPQIASQVLEIVENEFHRTLTSLPINSKIQIFIGEENLIPNFTSCSMLALTYNHPAGKGTLGLLGPTRMDYAFGTVILEHIQKNLQNL